MNDDVAELVQRCLAGSESAWREFVERFEQPVFSLCLRMLGHRHDAEDVAQESLLRAVRHIGKWNPEKTFLPWLLTIAANRCRTAIERRTRRPAPASLDGDPPPRAGSLDPREIAEEVERALAELREDYRTCFILFYQNELSCAEIGEVMGCPTGTVKTWLHRARAELAARLRERGLSPESDHELPRVSETA